MCGSRRDRGAFRGILPSKDSLIHGIRPAGLESKPLEGGRLAAHAWRASRYMIRRHEVRRTPNIRNVPLCTFGFRYEGHAICVAIPRRVGFCYPTWLGNTLKSEDQ